MCFHDLVLQSLANLCLMAQFASFIFVIVGTASIALEEVW
jgi:hypothetical protein